MVDGHSSTSRIGRSRSESAIEAAAVDGIAVGGEATAAGLIDLLQIGHAWEKLLPEY